jgi:hypothetical protein
MHSFFFPFVYININFYAIDRSRETCTDIDTLYEYTSCIWPSFVYHYLLAICDCLRFTKVFGQYEDEVSEMATQM